MCFGGGKEGALLECREITTSAIFLRALGEGTLGVDSGDLTRLALGVPASLAFPFNREHKGIQISSESESECGLGMLELCLALGLGRSLTGEGSTDEMIGEDVDPIQTMCVDCAHGGVYECGPVA